MTRTAIVTGAAQGIGKAIALRLASDGVDVAVNDIPQKREAVLEVVGAIKAAGRKSLAIIGDVTKESEVQAMVKETVEELGGLDILYTPFQQMVANAGIYEWYSILDVPEESFDRVMSVNCKGVLFCYRAAAAQMIKQGRGGRIIGAASVYGHKGQSNIVSYVASKFAIRAITQTAALEWGQHNITVNVYAPAFIDTEIARSVDDIAGAGTVQALMQGACLPRMGTPEEVAAVASFLASEEASYITGQSFGVNGGMILS
ncbi:Enoyl-(Acyl carrier protein) reductase [Ceratobasidium sp. AG-Ba]|nr:Enoyl-(Acyl carrier protein) reductase [Ceratobasidium sp. AG-Ba]